MRKTARPIDDYSPDWAAYWAENPHMTRSVGADVPEGEEEDKEPEQEPDWKAVAQELTGKMSEFESQFGKLKEENEKLRKSKQEILDERKQAAEEAEQAKLEAAKKDGRVEDIEKSWSQKLESTIEELKGQYEPKLQSMQSKLHEMTVGATASEIASKVFINNKVGLPQILPRLSLEEGDDGFKVRVLDKDGKPSAMTTEDLMKELSSDPDLANIVVGSKASGAGSTGKSGGGGGEKLNRSKMTADQMNDYIKEHGRDAYLKLPK